MRIPSSAPEGGSRTPVNTTSACEIAIALSRSLPFEQTAVYLPPLQSIFSTAALPAQDLVVLACFPVIVWGSDELWRWRMRRREIR